LSEGDVRLPKLFRQTVSQRWQNSGHRTGCVISWPSTFNCASAANSRRWRHCVCWLSVRCASINIYFAWCDISLLTAGMSV